MDARDVVCFVQTKKVKNENKIKYEIIANRKRLV